MSDKRNCQSCGAPLDSDVNKCPYCGTSYFDMSCIDIDNGDPFTLKIRRGNILITQLVKPKIGGISITHSTEMAYGCAGIGRVQSVQFPTSQELNTNIEFTAIVMKNGSLATIEIADEGDKYGAQRSIDNIFKTSDGVWNADADGVDSEKRG